MEKGHAVYSTKSKILRGIVWVLMLILALFMVFPILYIILGSFKENSELLVGGTNILPSHWVFSNYSDAWKQANFATYTMNSIFLALGVMTITLLTSTMSGYVFSRRNFRGKELLYSLFVAFMFINVGSVSLRPLFELAVKLHMNKNLFSVILISVGTGQATYIFLCRGFVNSLPKELDEAAKIDGANSLQIFTKIMLPAVKPVMLAVLVMSLVYNWNDFFSPLIYLNDNKKFTIAIGLQFFKGSQGNVQIGQMMAMSLVALLPVLIIFAVCQKYFIQGIKMSGLKG